MGAFRDRRVMQIKLLEMETELVTFGTPGETESETEENEDILTPVSSANTSLSQLSMEFACEPGGNGVGQESFQHVELHIVDSEEEALELRATLVARPDQNVHLLACARELSIMGLVPTQMDAMAGSIPLFTYIVATEPGPTPDIARSLMLEFEPASSPGTEPNLSIDSDAEQEQELNSDQLQVDVEGVDCVAKPVPVTVVPVKPRKPAAKKVVASMNLKRKRVEQAKVAVVGGVEEDDLCEARSKSLRGSSDTKCLYCDYTSSKKYLLARHMRSHSDERPFMCKLEDCQRGFKTAASLQNHINTHGGIKPHQCRFEGCGMAFTTSGELVRHARYKHTHEKPHKCQHPDCGYESVELSKLKRHLRSHTGERPFKCQHCDYASPDTYKLKRHLRVHTGEKPYECEICQQRFTQSNSMKAHRLIHDNKRARFSCSLCPIVCVRKAELNNHMSIAHPSDEPIVCAKCLKTFPDKYLLNVHKRANAICGPLLTSVGRPSRPRTSRRGPQAGLLPLRLPVVNRIVDEQETPAEAVAKEDACSAEHVVKSLTPDAEVEDVGSSSIIVQSPDDLLEPQNPLIMAESTRAPLSIQAHPGVPAEQAGKDIAASDVSETGASKLKTKGPVARPGRQAQSSSPAWKRPRHTPNRSSANP